MDGGFSGYARTSWTDTRFRKGVALSAQTPHLPGRTRSSFPTNDLIIPHMFRILQIGPSVYYLSTGVKSLRAALMPYQTFLGRCLGLRHLSNLQVTVNAIGCAHRLEGDLG